MKELKRDLLRTKYTRVLAEEDFKYNAPHYFEVVSVEDDEPLCAIHFQEGPINYGTFTVTSGTTWADWIGSGRTFDDGLMLIIDGNGHVVNSEGIYELQYNGATVNGSDQIISSATYTLFNIYG